MKAGLLEQIQGMGHWRFNIQPLRSDLPKLGWQAAQELISNERVQIRGWDFPHYSNRNDEESGAANYNEYGEHWCDWYRHKEFWRMYRSTQFLSYNVLWEDFKPETGQNPRPEGKLLSVKGAIWTIIEFVEFAHRLHQRGLYADGAKISVNLRNSVDRQLWITDWNRVGFSYPRVAHEPDIALTRIVDKGVLGAGHKDLAIDFMVELFEMFNWSPDRSSLARDQTKFYNREFE